MGSTAAVLARGNANDAHVESSQGKTFGQVKRAEAGSAVPSLFSLVELYRGDSHGSLLASLIGIAGRGEDSELWLLLCAVLERKMESSNNYA